MCRIFSFYHEYMHVLLLFILFIFIPSPALHAEEFNAPPLSYTSVAAYHRSLPRIHAILDSKQLSFGAPVFVRIFKQENELELWIQNQQHYKLYKTYIICFNSGTLGPKLQEGDRQSPEGFYQVGYNQMNPWSNYHLAFNLGYPNEYDRYHKRSGSALMIHGRCSSDGCFAMTDYYMDEIYTLVNEALSHGQRLMQVHIFPFRFSEQNMKNHQDSPWYPFWTNLKEGYDFFEDHHIPPVISVVNGRYAVSSPASIQQLARDVEQLGQNSKSTM